jgi:FtsZ-binding cell division protein ZapB
MSSNLIDKLEECNENLGMEVDRLKEDNEDLIRQLNEVAAERDKLLSALEFLIAADEHKYEPGKEEYWVGAQSLAVDNARSLLRAIKGSL